MVILNLNPFIVTSEKSFLKLVFMIEDTKNNKKSQTDDISQQEKVKTLSRFGKIYGLS